MANDSPGLRGLYPEIAPYETGRLAVGEGHDIYYERCGTRGGKPVVFLHGGPGAGCHPDHRRLFDPSRYDVLLFDQRGCGRSTPFFRLEGNTTFHLVEDIERLRSMAGVEQWMLFGGSWGSSLALAYAQRYPHRVTEMILRGIYTWTAAEAHWYYQFGASEFFPDHWARFIEPIPPAERDNIIAAYYQRLTGTDEQARLEAAKAWNAWEEATVRLISPLPGEGEFTDAGLASALFETHYLVNSAWLKEGQLIAEAWRLKGIRGTIIHGRFDMACRPRYAHALHQAWPGSELHIVEAAGHVVSEPGLLDRLIRETDRYGRNSPTVL